MRTVRVSDYETVTPAVVGIMCRIDREAHTHASELDDARVAKVKVTLLNRICGGAPKPKVPAVKARPKGK